MYKNLTLTEILRKLETVANVSKKEIYSKELRKVLTDEDIVFHKHWSYFQKGYSELQKRKQVYDSKK